MQMVVNINFRQNDSASKWPKRHRIEIGKSLLGLNSLRTQKFEYYGESCLTDF